MGIDEDRHLVEECISGNTRSEKRLYTKYANVVYTICYRYSRNEEDASDILQETFMRVFEKLNQYKGEGSLEGWIRRVAITTSIRFYRKSLKKKSVRELSESEYEHNDIETPLEVISAKEIMQLINGLSDIYRIIFNMHAIEGYSHKEIGEHLGITEVASRARLKRAKKQLIILLKTKNHVTC